ncbi:HEPN domain-containing protein [Vibrio sp. RC27]
MANTDLFQSLELRLADLRTNLLPEEFDALAGYDDKTLDMTKGYTLLVHSEVEYYIESICYKFVELQVLKYRQTKQPSACAMALITYSKLDWSATNEEVEIPTINSSKLSDSLTTLLTKMSLSYYGIINSNNGIKAKNLRKLVAPTGMIDHFPEVNMEDFSTFGGHRGNLAHVSTRHINFTIDPSDQLNKLTNNILPTLKAFDESLLNEEPQLASVVWSDVKPGQLVA